MTNSPHTSASARKAAILISTLDVESADRLLEQLPENLADQVRQLTLALDDVSAVERDAVVREFFAAGGRSRGQTVDPQTQADTGVELDLQTDLSSLEPSTEPTILRSSPAGETTEPGTSYEHQAPAPSTSETESNSKAPRFAALHQAEAASLKQLLRDEHPQIVAVIVAHLPRERAAQLLAELPSPRREEVARRIRHLAELHPEILRDLEQGLAARFSHLGLDSSGSVQGQTILREILEAAPKPLQNQLRASLESSDAATQPDEEQQSRTLSRTNQSRKAIPAQSLPMVFADVQRLTGDSLFQVFTAVAPEEAILALFDAPESFVARVLDQLSPREARVWRYALANPGPIRLSDVISAQARIALAAEELAAAGRINLPFQHMALVA